MTFLGNFEALLFYLFFVVQRVLVKLSALVALWKKAHVMLLVRAALLKALEKINPKVGGQWNRKRKKVV